MIRTASNTSKISIPTSLTTATLLFVEQDESPNELPSEYYHLPYFRLKKDIWEDQYFPEGDYDFYSDEIMIIHNFALSLLQESENIPSKFAEIINEDFWEII